MGCNRRFGIALGLALALVGAAARPAAAAFHLIKVVEVFPGTNAQPAAQYIELQMYFGGQNFVSGTSVAIYDANDAELGRFTFTGNVASGADQAKILISTTQAQTLFNLTANLTMTNILPLAGGKVCFEAGVASYIDCVAWGRHIGSAPGGGAGNVGAPFSPVLGLRRGIAIVRRLDLGVPTTALDAGDDTNNCATDWRTATPAPRNNAGTAGTLPSSTCGNNTTEGLESCDDGNTAAGDGCGATCIDEACGDGATNDVSETCDDGNLTNGDGCDNNCRITACGNGVVSAGEMCDDGNLTDGDGCDHTCRPTGCGSGVITAGETCDDGNLTSGDGCDANCTPTGCGNGIVTAGEDCEPPGVGSCDASCQLPCVTPADCADTDPCTTNERCTATGCAVDPVPVDDGEPCTVDSCGATGVIHAGLPDGMTCTLASMPTVRALCIDAVCGVARCGDGFVDVGAPGGAEECDDGNTIDTDACTSACEAARCGDGFVQAGETCDDGNTTQTDACTNACEAARCGDGFTGPGETCDDDNAVGNDGCSATCQTERCGDGTQQSSEGCDDGNTTAGDGCSATCAVESEPPADDDGGCCGTGRGGATSALLGLVVLGLLGRRRVARVTGPARRRATAAGGPRSGPSRGRRGRAA